MRPAAADAGTVSWRPRNASRGVIASSPHGGAGAKRAARPPASSPALCCRDAQRGDEAVGEHGRRLAHAEHADDHVLPGELEVDVADLAQHRGQLVAADRQPTHVDGEPQRVVGEHAGAADEALVEHVESRDLADLRPREVDRARRSRRSARARGRRRGGAAASSDAKSSELGLVDSVSVTVRSTMSASSREPLPRCSIADWPRLPTILCVLEITRSAPAASACSGRSSWNAMCAPQASSTTSGTSCACATSASPRTSAAEPK